MKRSRKVNLVLGSALSTSLWFTGCGRSANTSSLSGKALPAESPSVTYNSGASGDWGSASPTNGVQQVYTNNHFVSGHGYYHAPYFGWFPHPYNYFLPSRGYFHGGLWSAQPHVSDLIVSRPTPQALAQVMQNQGNVLGGGGPQDESRPNRSSSSTASRSSPLWSSSRSSGSTIGRSSNSGSSRSSGSSGGSVSRGGFGSSGHASSS